MAAATPQQVHIDPVADGAQAAEATVPVAEVAEEHVEVEPRSEEEPSLQDDAKKDVEEGATDIDGATDSPSSKKDTEGQEEEEVTDEEAEWMRNDLINKARGLQELITTLKQNEQSLKEDVQDFLLREVAEMKCSSALSDRVEETERRALKNPDYVRWAMAHEKGVFARDAADPVELRNLQEEMVRETSWLSQVSASYRPLKAASVPIALAQVWGQWREANESADATEAEFFRATTSFLEAEAEVVWLLNGVPLLDSQPMRTGVEDGSTVQWFRNEANVASAVSCNKAAHQCMTWTRATSRFASRLSLSDTIHNSLALSSILTSEEGNTLVAVPAAVMASSIPVRAFVFFGQLGAVETLDPHVNLLECFSIHAKSVQNAVGETVTHCREQGLFNVEGELGHGAIVTVLLRVGGDGSAASPSVMLADVRPVSPDVPYSWHFSWSDVCGVGRQMKSSLQGGATAEELREQITFRYTSFAVEELKPYDELTHVWFPYLWGEHATKAIGQDGGQSLWRKSSVAIAATALAVAAVGVGITGHLRRRH